MLLKAKITYIGFIKKIHFYNTFSAKNSIILAVLFLSCAFCIFQSLNGTGENNRYYLFITLGIAVLVFGRIAYNQRHDHWVQYSPWRVVFNLGEKKRVIKIRDVREIVLKEKQMEIKKRNDGSVRVDLSLYTEEEIKRFEALFKNGSLRS